MRTIKIGLIGLGTVGSSVLALLSDEKVTTCAGVRFEVTEIVVKDLTRQRNTLSHRPKIHSDPLALVHFPDVEYVIELMGEHQLAYEVMKAAIQLKKPVITANKAVLAKWGKELLTLSAEKGVPFAFEAAVAGGIPVIKVLNEGLAANEVHNIIGILNGTSNYILSSMTENNESMAVALQKAQAAGFAEADPSRDIDGDDALDKIQILAGLAYGCWEKSTALAVEGLRHLQVEDIREAKALGFVFKLLACAKKMQDKIWITVRPTLVPDYHVLSRVSGAMNAVYLEASETGPLLLYGQGAGGKPTASAVVADVIDVVKGQMMRFSLTSETPLKEGASVAHAYYLRMQGRHKPGTLASITAVFAKFQISIESITQRHQFATPDSLPIIIMTHAVAEATLKEALVCLNHLPEIAEPVVAVPLLKTSETKEDAFYVD